MDKRELIMNFIIAKNDICDSHQYCDECELDAICKDPTDLKNISTAITDEEIRYFLGNDTELRKEDVEAFFDNRRNICTKAKQCRYCPINEGERDGIVGHVCSFRTGEISEENFAYVMSYRR